MKKISKKIMSFFLIFTMVFSLNTTVFASENAFSFININSSSDIIEVKTDTLIRLEDGRNVSPEELLTILRHYSGNIYPMDDPELETLVHYNSYNSYNSYKPRAAIALPMSDVLQIMAGTWYIPGIGKIVVVGGAIYIGGVAIYKVSGWIAEQVTNWLASRALAKQVDDAVDELGDVDSNRVHHILLEKHNWNSLVPGPHKDPNRWNKIKEIIRKVLMEGTEMPYGSFARKKVLHYRGKIVEVTYRKFPDGTIKISDGWVVK